MHMRHKKSETGQKPLRPGTQPKDVANTILRDTILTTWDNTAMLQTDNRKRNTSEAPCSDTQLSPKKKIKAFLRDKGRQRYAR